MTGPSTTRAVLNINAVDAAGNIVKAGAPGEFTDERLAHYEARGFAVVRELEPARRKPVSMASTES